MKKVFAVMLILMFSLFASSAFAAWWTAPETGYYSAPGGNVFFFEQGDKAPGSFEFIGGANVGGEGGGGNNTNTNTNTNENKNTNTNLNTNMNSNKNENTNVNFNGGNKQGQAQGQGQLQGQAQGQMQGQAAIAVQGQTAHNSGVNQTVIMEDKRELISPPPVAIPDAQLSREKAGEILTLGTLWGAVSKVTAAEVDSILKCGIFGCDVDVKVRALGAADQTSEITLAKQAGVKYLGTIYVMSTGEDMIACEATAIREAMKLGATSIVKLEVGSKVVSQGKSYGIGLGGGASMFGHDDTIAIAPAGGFGYGGAKASNERLPQAMFAIYGK